MSTHRRPNGAKLCTEKDGCWFVVVGRMRGRKVHSIAFALRCFRATGLIKPRWRRA